MGKLNSRLHIPVSSLIIAHDLCGVGELSEGVEKDVDEPLHSCRIFARFDYSDSGC